MHVPSYLKNVSKVIGWFSYTPAGEVCCDGDACVIAETEEKMKFYVNKLGQSDQKDIIKKTRFGEIIDGMRKGGAYAFDEGSYSRFYDHAVINKITGLPAKEEFLENADTGMDFIRVQIV